MKVVKNRRLPLMRIAIIASVILGLVQVILIGAAYQRRTAANQLQEEKNSLEENISSLIQVNQDQVNNLQAELDQTLADIADLEASFPDLGAHFAIYHRGLDLANQSQVDLLSITRLSADNVDTYAGQVQDKQYSIEVIGGIDDCIQFIGNLEKAGRDTLSMRSVYIWPLENHCSLEISLIGFSKEAGE